MKTALVTGANSGIGFETAKALAIEGAATVYVACRSISTALEACAALVRATSLDVFTPIALDLASLEDVRRAASDLSNASGGIDLLVLNAGVLPGKQRLFTKDGLEVTSAASLVGHHVLVVRLLRAGLLASKARIVISGSEGARGDAPGMKPLDLSSLAHASFGGNLTSAISAFVRMAPPLAHHWSTTYCTTKALVALWARALARELPRGMTVNAVSPGNAPGTRAARHQPWWFRVMMRMAARLGPALGLAMPASSAAQRYLAVAAMGDDVNGLFFASPPKKLVGRLERQHVLSLIDDRAAEATMQALVELTGESAPSSSGAASQKLGGRAYNAAGLG